VQILQNYFVSGISFIDYTAAESRMSEIAVVDCDDRCYLREYINIIIGGVV
jgi:hypothetical protein